MESFEALALVIGRDTRDIARAVGREPITLNKWKADPIDGSGARNPLDHLREMIQAALNLGRDPKDALAPLRYLEECFSPHAQNVDLNEAHQDLFNEFSQLLSEHTSALRDGKISPMERRRIEKEAIHVKRQLEEYVDAVVASVGAAAR